MKRNAQNKIQIFTSKHLTKPLLYHDGQDLKRNVQNKNSLFKCNLLKHCDIMMSKALKHNAQSNPIFTNKELNIAAIMA